MKKYSTTSSKDGFSLVELVVAIAVLGAVASIGFAVLSNYKKPIAGIKMEQDIVVLNAAVSGYLSSGGNLNSVTDLEAVIAKLKTKAVSAQSAEIAGLKGSFLDRRTKAVMQTTAEAGTTEPRVLWIAADKRFRLATSGAGGAKEIVLDEAITGAPAEETRDVKLKLATEDKWVWDYTDNALPDRATFDDAPVANVTPTAPTAPAGGVKGPLLAPTFSEPGGTYPLISYDRSLTISDPNTGGVSQILYSVNGGTYGIYSSAALPVAPGTTISAYAMTIDPDNWSDSPVVTETYDTVPVVLDVDLSVPSLAVNYGEVGGAMIPGSNPSPIPLAPGWVTLVNAAQVPASYQNDSVFSVHWTYDGSDPVSSGTRQTAAPFSGGFPGQAVDYSLAWWGSATNLPIQVVAKTLNTSVVSTSSVSTKVLSVSPISLRPPLITLSGTDVIIDPDYDYGDTPAGARIYYTVDGTDPGDLNGVPTSGTPYTGPFPIASSGGNDIKARVYAPDTFEQWFVASGVTTETPPIPVITFTMTVSTSAP